MNDQIYKDFKVPWVIKVLLLLLIAWFLFRTYKAIYIYQAEQNYEPAIAQCEKYGGVKGVTPVEAEGVYDSSRVGGWKEDVFKRALLFFEQGVEFVEFPSDGVTFKRRTNFAYGDPQFKEGKTYQTYLYYRLFRAEKGHPLCGPYGRLVKNGYPKYKKLFNENECVAVEGFDDKTLLKAPYELKNFRPVINEGAEVTWTSLTLLDRKSGSEVASYNHFHQCFTKMIGSGDFWRCSNAQGNSKLWVRCPSDAKKRTADWKEFQENLFTLKKEG
jgi:hypothetical protein